MSIADNIKRLRETYGLTQAELGAIAGVTDKAVSTWESGEKAPRMGAVQKIADHFGISKSAILLDETDRERSPAPMDPDLAHLLESLRTRPEMRMLFDLADNATAEDVRKAVAIIEALMREDGR